MNNDEKIKLGRYDIRLIAQAQLARVGQGELPLEPIRRHTEDESKVWVLTTEGYDLFSKQEIAEGYQKYMRAQVA